MSKPGKFTSITFIDRFSSEEDRIEKLAKHRAFFEPEWLGPIALLVRALGYPYVPKKRAVVLTI